MNLPDLPDKLYFRIGEVCNLLSIKPHVLRYWETEFPQIRPSKTSGGLRLFQKRDIEVIARIKYLLYEKGYTISGARKELSEQSSPEPYNPDGDDILKNILGELRNIREILS